MSDKPPIPHPDCLVVATGQIKETTLNGEVCEYDTFRIRTRNCDSECG